MELRQLKYFIEVAKREHMTEAANTLHVAQSAISRQIVNLEEELGVDLFIREGRTIRLTRVGEVFLKHMDKAMHVIEDGLQAVEEYTDPQKGIIQIGFPASLASYIMPTAIYYFRKQYPDVHFSLHQNTYQGLIEDVVKGKINIAVLGPSPQYEEKIKSTILFTEKIVALLPSSHHLANRSSLRLVELQEEAFVLFPQGYVLHKVIMEGCKQRGFTPNVAFEGEDLDMIKGLVSAGLGVTLIPEVTIVDCLPRSTVRIPITEPTLKRSVAAIVPKERELLPTEQLFYEFMQDFFARIEYFQQ